ncbi:MAG: phosphatase PAP2 family protein [Candidatus Wildermuthbacteria bacterium]|nr:phosphatase PAP2 family protein [Candidatus Wildermuthbacteria bacterium]
MEIGKAVIIFFATYAGYLLMGGLLVFLLRGWKKHIVLVLQMIVAAILSRGVITEAIRLVWHRARPFVEQNFVPIIPHANSASFPSGHATFFFAVGTVLYLYNKKAGMAFLLGSALIGIARVLAGVHWPSDIVWGALIGVACGLAVSKFAILYSKRSHAN